MITIALKPGDPTVLEINKNKVTSEHPLNTFDSIHVDTLEGEDQVVFDDANGAVAWLCELEVNLGDGDDKFVGGTGSSLTVDDILDLLEMIDGARVLIDHVDALVTLLGASGMRGGLGDDMISRAVTLLERTHTDFVQPAATFVEDFNDTLIQPMADEVIATRDELITDAAELIVNAQAGLATDAEALMDSADADLKLGAEALVAQAEILRDQAVAHQASCFDQLHPPPDGTSNLIDELNALASKLDTPPGHLEDCDMNEPDNPDDPLIDDCPDIEEIVDCMGRLIEDFELLAALCECEGDLLAEDGELLAASTLGEDYETPALEAQGDALVVAADDLVTSAEDYAERVQMQIQDAVDDNMGNGLAIYAETHFVEGGATYQDDVITEIGGKAIELESEAALLMAELEQFILDLEAILESGMGATGRSGNVGCSSIITTTVINGGKGNDKLLGTLGNDLIHGNEDDDTIVGWAGDDVLYGDDGFDVILGWLGTNEIHGGDSGDILVGGFGADCIFGDDFGEDGLDLIVGLTGDDQLEGGMSTDIIIGNNGDDVLRGGDGIDLLIGDLSLPPEPGNDTIFGDDDFDVLIGGDGEDHMYGGPGQSFTILGITIDLGNVMLGGGDVDVMYGEDDDGATVDDEYIDVMLGGDEVGPGDQMHGGNGGDLALVGVAPFMLGNVMLGQDGDDTITSKDGFDVLFGGANDDIISADQGAGVLIGLVSLELGDLVFGGDGNDCLHGDGEWGVPACSLGVPCCALTVGANEQDLDLLFGGIGDDTLYGYDGGDLTIGSFSIMIGNPSFGGDGDDEIYSEDGIDFAFGGDGDDTIECGEGYGFDNIAGTFHLAFGDFIFGQGGVDTLHGDKPASSGGPREGDIDVILGGPDGDHIYGGGGGEVYNLSEPIVYFVFGDFLFGEGGEDYIYGDVQQVDLNSRKNGIDQIFAGPDDDTVDAGPGSELIILIPSGPTIVTMNFGNVIFGQGEDDIIVGADDSFLVLEGGIDLVFGGAGADQINTGNGIDLVFGNDGIDTIDLGEGGAFVINLVPIPLGNIAFGNDDDDTIVSDGRVLEIDLLFGNQCDDTIYAGGGLLDVIFGNLGDDTIHCGDGFLDLDLAFGGRGEDMIHADDGGLLNLIFAGEGNDTLFGGDGGADIFFGNGGDEKEMSAGGGLLDLVFGNDGNDTIKGEDGVTNVLFGGSGADHIIAGDASVFNLAFGNSDPDGIDGGGALELLFGNGGADQIDAGGGLNFAFGNSEDDVLIGDGGNFFFGNSGNDYLEGGVGVDLFFGNSGDDQLCGGNGANLLVGGPENDLIIGGDGLDVGFGGADNDSLYGKGGTDVLFGNRDADSVYGQDGSDLACGNRGADTAVSGGAGNDLVFGNREDDSVYGDGGTDFVFGNRHDDDVYAGDDSDADYVFGNRGNDNLYRCNNDLLFGGLGIDTKTSNCSDATVTVPGCGPINPTTDPCRLAADGLNCEGGCAQPDYMCVPTYGLVGKCTLDGRHCDDNDDCACGDTCTLEAGIVECDCQQDLCRPAADGLSCEGSCPESGQVCVPSVIDHSLGMILECDCIGDGECHVEFNMPKEPVCVGECPLDETCTLTDSDNLFECHCPAFLVDEAIGSAYSTARTGGCTVNADFTGCEPSICPDPNQVCGPTEVATIGLCTGIGTPCSTDDDCPSPSLCSFVQGVSECDCVDADECRLVFDPVLGPDCVGTCEEGEDCVLLELCGVLYCDCLEDRSGNCCLYLCDGDASGDGIVDPLDAGYVKARFGCPVGTGDVGCDCADVSGDGVVDPLDAGYVAARFGTCN